MRSMRYSIISDHYKSHVSCQAGRALAGGTGLGGHFCCQSSQHVFSVHQPPLARYTWLHGFSVHQLHPATRGYIVLSALHCGVWTIAWKINCYSSVIRSWWSFKCFHANLDSSSRYWLHAAPRGPAVIMMQWMSVCSRTGKSGFISHHFTSLNVWITWNNPKIIIAN